MMEDIMIGADLVKNFFQVHGALMTGQVTFCAKVSRSKFPGFIAKQPPSLVVMEACGSAYYWEQEMVKLGHDVKLIAPKYVKPFVKRLKNDVADAETIVVAAQRPEMRFVECKSDDQQARTILFSNRDRLVGLRTELIKALRACLYDYGHVAPQGIGYIKQIAEILNA